MALIKASQRTLRNAKCGHVNAHYWAKDGTTGKFYLIDATDETRDVPVGGFVPETSVSACFKSGNRQHNNDTSETKTETKTIVEIEPESVKDEIVTTTTTASTAKPATADKAAVLATLLETLSASSVDPSQVREIVKEELQGMVFPTNTVVVREGVTTKVEGLTHNKLARVLMWLSLGSHVYLYGPASSGKSHMGHQCADALNIKYQGLFPVSAGTMDSDLMGYIIPGTGDYHESGLYRAVRFGGVYMIDEVDKGHPGIIAILNAITANGEVEFPCGPVKVHADFRLIVTGNTYGTGPDALYVGSQQLDAATLTRFRRIEIPYDYALETALCAATGLDAARVKLVVDYVKALRNNVTTHRLPLIFAPRQTVALCTAINAGMPWRDAWGDAMQAGISPTDWAKVSNGVKVPVI